MLDLTKMNERSYELKWFDGQVLHLRVPTQETLLRIVDIEKLDDMGQQMDEMKAILVDVLNDNAEGYTLTEDDKAQLTLQIMEIILEDYMGSLTAKLGE